MKRKVVMVRLPKALVSRAYKQLEPAIREAEDSIALAELFEATSRRSKTKAVRLLLLQRILELEAKK